MKSGVANNQRKFLQSKVVKTNSAHGYSKAGSVMNNNIVPTTDSLVTLNKNTGKVLFTSGSSLDWNIARKSLIEAFKRNDCYDLVEL